MISVPKNSIFSRCVIGAPDELNLSYELKMGLPKLILPHFQLKFESNSVLVPHNLPSYKLSEVLNWVWFEFKPDQGYLQDQGVIII
jgi:hypothetical protein